MIQDRDIFVLPCAPCPPAEAHLKGFMLGQLQAIHSLILATQETLVAQNEHVAWTNLQDAIYALNRAHTAVDR